jgi:oligosaccharide repeat unit polymerase
MMAVFFRLAQGSWFAPGSSWAAFWFGGTAIPLILAPEFYVAPRAVWIVAAFTFTIGISSQLGRYVGRHKHSERQGAGTGGPGDTVLPGWKIIMFAALICAGLAGQIMAGQIGASLSDLFNPVVLARIASSLSELRYQGFEEPVEVRLLMIFVYLSSLLGGEMYAREPKQRVFLFASLPMVGSLFYSILTTAKAGFLFSAIFWVSAWFAGSIARGRYPFRITLRVAIVSSCSVAALLALFVLAMRLRYGEDGVQDHSFVYTRIKEYLVAHLSVFSSWLDYTRDHGLQLQWGAAEYFGLADHFGLTTRQQGAFGFVQQYGYLADSNIYSIYRGLIEDFSLPGALAFAGIASLFAGIAYERTRGKGAGGWPAMLTAFYVTLLSSHVLNPFGYTSLLIAFVAYASFLSIGSLKLRRRAEPKSAAV